MREASDKVVAQNLLDILLELDANGGDDEEGGAIDQDRLAAAQEGRGVGGDGGDDYSDILAGITRILAASGGLVEEQSSDGMNNEAQIAENEEEDKDPVTRSGLGKEGSRERVDSSRRGHDGRQHVL